MLFGKKIVDTDMLVSLYLNNVPLEFMHEWKYLGTTVVSGKSLGFSARPDISSFYRAANSVLNVLTDAKENVLMQLLYTNCIPILSYCCAVKAFSSQDMTDCNTAINNVIRKIFGFHRWESVRLLRESFGYLSIYEIFAKARVKFLKSCSVNLNPVIAMIASLELV